MKKVCLVNYAALDGIINENSEKIFFSQFFIKAKRRLPDNTIRSLESSFLEYISKVQELARQQKTLQELFKTLPNNAWAIIRKQAIYRLMMKNPKNRLII